MGCLMVYGSVTERVSEAREGQHIVMNGFVVLRFHMRCSRVMAWDA